MIKAEHQPDTKEAADVAAEDTDKAKAEAADKAAEGADKAKSPEDQIKALTEQVAELKTALGEEQKARKEAESAAAKFQSSTKKAFGIEDEPEPDAVAKALADDSVPDTIKVVLKAQAEANKALEAQAAKDREAVEKMRDAELTREFVIKARSLSHLATEPDTLAPVLKAAHAALDPVVFAEFDRLLLAAEAASSQAETILSKSLGHGGRPATGSAMDQVQQLVVTKAVANPNLTPEQIEAEVWGEHPELVDAYRTEQINGGN